jgi:hypothetical protein
MSIRGDHIESKAMWIENVDRNTMYFHHFPNKRKKSNTIWELRDGEGKMVRKFSKIVDLGVRHFKGIYSKPRRANT